MIEKLLPKIGVKRGNVYAESLANQSYWYRLGYVWINTLMIEDKRDTPLNPLRWSILDFAWVIYFCFWSSVLIVFMTAFGWVKAAAIADVVPIAFSGGSPSTRYTFTKKWYYDNGKIKVD